MNLAAHQPDEDYFALFGLPRSHQVDLERLDAAYEQLSFETHPDFLVTAPEEERRVAQRISARINEAYRTLHSELERSVYLLQLLADKQTLDPQALPPGFLAQVFELQEQVDEVEAASQGDTSALRQEFHDRLARVRQERAALFEAAAQAATPETLNAIQANLNSERYLQRLLTRVN